MQALVAALGLVAQIMRPPVPWTSSLGWPTEIAGVYETCNERGVCRTIDIRADGTFWYTPADPIVKWPPLEGRWTELEPGVVSASTLQQPTSLPLTAQSKPVEKLTFCVTDELTGAPIRDAWVSFGAEGIAAYVDTDESGCVSMPRYRNVRRIEVTHHKFETATYDVEKSDANFFGIRLRTPEPFLKDEKWVIRDGVLLVLATEPLVRK